MDNQDWKPVKIESTKLRTLTNKPYHANVSESTHAMKKIEQSEVTRIKMLTPKSRSDMAQARVAKGFTQRQLDQRCQFPANTVNGWEAGKTCPTGPQINILHRILGIKLERD